MTRYLLYTSDQITAYKSKYGPFIRKMAPAYTQWVRGLKCWEWVPLRLPQGQEEAIIGLICLLHIRNIINITFSDDMTRIQRNPQTDEEYNKAYEEATNQTLKKS